MTKNVITVAPETKITKVAEILSENRFHAVPVAEEGRVVGIVAEDDFFTRNSGNVFLPSYIQFIKGTKVVDALARGKKEKLEKLMNLEAKDIMSKDCVSILGEMDISDLLEFFRETKYTTLPVIDNQDKLIGIVTFSDIIGLIKTPDHDKARIKK
jgi:acetoin utilization protein AcuB